MTIDTADDTTTETVEAPDAADETTTEADEAQVDGDTKPAAEAARWRRKLRETETERDALRDRLATLQTAEVERLATGPGALALGADLWHSHALADFLDPAGNVDAEAIRRAVAGLLTTHAHYAHRRFQGGADGGVRSNPPASTTWGNVLRG